MALDLGYITGETSAEAGALGSEELWVAAGRKRLDHSEERLDSAEIAQLERRLHRSRESLLHVLLR